MRTAVMENFPSRMGNHKAVLSNMKVDVLFKFVVQNKTFIYIFIFIYIYIYIYIFIYQSDGRERLISAHVRDGQRGWSVNTGFSLSPSLYSIFQISSPMSQNGFIYVVLYAESIPHGLEAIRRDSGPVFKDLLFVQSVNFGEWSRMRVRKNEFG